MASRDRGEELRRGETIPDPPKLGGAFYGPLRFGLRIDRRG